MSSNEIKPVKYGVLGAAGMAVFTYMFMLVGTYFKYGELFTGLGEPADFYYLWLFWTCAGVYVGISLRKQYVGYIANFIDEHKDIAQPEAKRLAIRGFKILYARQLFPVVALFPFAYYTFELQIPDSFGDFAFMAVLEIIAYRLYKIKNQNIY